MGVNALIRGDRVLARDRLERALEIARAAGSIPAEFNLLPYLALAFDSGTGDFLRAAEKLLTVEHPERDRLFCRICSAVLDARNGREAAARKTLSQVDRMDDANLGPDGRIARMFLREELSFVADTL